MLRVVLDTNVIVSAVISKGKPRELLNRGIENRFSIVTSDYILKEIFSLLYYLGQRFPEPSVTHH